MSTQALGSITTNKASGGDGIPVELFHLSGKMTLWKCCTQYASKFGKLSSGHRTGKGQFSCNPKKSNAEECSNYRTIAFISHASKVMLKILQARLQQYVNWELPDVQAGFRKGRGKRDQIANICWIMEKAREFSPGCSLEGLMLKLKLQYFGHLMQRADSLEKTLMLGKIEDRRRRGRWRMRWLDGITD